MDHNSSRAEAERWLYTANKLLTARDLHGARSFAIRARESDPRFEATELLLTVIDTLVAGETRINDQHDWYGILQILRYTQNIDYIAAQYRRLALLLDPHRNRFAFSGHAFTLVHDAWSVLSNPAKKLLYDNELRMVTGPAPPAAPALNPFHAPNPVPTRSQRMQQQQQQQQQLPSARRSPKSKDGRAVAEEERPSPYNATTETARQNQNIESTRPSSETEAVTSFWTACPYCYVLYEYPKVYEECTLRCQSCRRGFQAVTIPAPPVTGKDAYFCCWGFFPLGFSGNFKDISGLSTNWNPFSSMFACPLQKGSKRKPKKGPWVYYDDDVAFVDLSDSSDGSSDVDWRSTGNVRRNKLRKVRRKGSATASGIVGRPPMERPRKPVHSGAGHTNLGNADGGSVLPNAARAESSKKAALVGSRRRAAADLGKLDLNVEFSNEVEDPNPAASERNVTGNVAEDNIEGIGFFEGLDEFLSSLPILNVVADDKVKGH